MCSKTSSNTQYEHSKGKSSLGRSQMLQKHSAMVEIELRHSPQRALLLIEQAKAFWKRNKYICREAKTIKENLKGWTKGLESQWQKLKSQKQLPASGQQRLRSQQELAAFLLPTSQGPSPAMPGEKEPQQEAAEIKKMFQIAVNYQSQNLHLGFKEREVLKLCTLLGEEPNIRESRSCWVWAIKRNIRGTWGQEVATKAPTNAAGSSSSRLSLTLGAGKIMELQHRPFPNRRMQNLFFLWFNHLNQL